MLGGLGHQSKRQRKKLSENEDISNECFLFSSCKTVNDCNGGCYVGGVDCNQPTTLTPEISTTTEDLTTTTYPQGYTLNYLLLLYF